MATVIQKDINEIEVVDAVVVNGESNTSELKSCVPGVICHPRDYFELISECKLCGRLC
jgi:hypothetical protein